MKCFQDKGHGWRQNQGTRLGTLNGGFSYDLRMPIQAILEQLFL